MNPVPDFDELVGDVEPEERERLLRTHELLVTAGPPPELSPELEAGPTLAMTLGGRRHAHARRRVLLLAAAIAVLLAAFLAGYVTGNDKSPGGRVLQLQGTSVAPTAEASLRLEDADVAGNWPMELNAVGLPKLPSRGYYEVFLVRNGKLFAPCGAFVVKNAKTGVTVRLNAPYRLHPGDSWVVTRQRAGDAGTGPVVLQPVT